MAIRLGAPRTHTTSTASGHVHMDTTQTRAAARQIHGTSTQLRAETRRLQLTLRSVGLNDSATQPLIHYADLLERLAETIEQRCHWAETAESAPLGSAIAALVYTAGPHLSPDGSPIDLLDPVALLLSLIGVVDEPALQAIEATRNTLGRAPGVGPAISVGTKAAAAATAVDAVIGLHSSYEHFREDFDQPEAMLLAGTRTALTTGASLWAASTVAPMVAPLATTGAGVAAATVLTGLFAHSANRSTGWLFDQAVANRHRPAQGWNWVRSEGTPIIQGVRDRASNLQDRVRTTASSWAEEGRDRAADGWDWGSEQLERLAEAESRPFSVEYFMDQGRSVLPDWLSEVSPTQTLLDTVAPLDGLPGLEPLPWFD